MVTRRKAHLPTLPQDGRRALAPAVQPAEPDPRAYAWPSLLARDGDELFDHYRHTLEALGQTILARAFLVGPERPALSVAFPANMAKLQEQEDMNEIIFVVEDAPEGGYTARAVGESIFTEAETLDDLHNRVRDAVRCHFDEGNAPKLIRLHFVRDEVIAA